MNLQKNTMCITCFWIYLLLIQLLQKSSFGQSTQGNISNSSSSAPQLTSDTTAALSTSNSISLTSLLSSNTTTAAALHITSTNSSTSAPWLSLNTTTVYNTSTNSSTSAPWLSLNTTTVSPPGCSSRPSPQCCTDRADACKPQGESCHCDSSCLHFGDCCYDYVDFCIKRTTVQPSTSSVEQSTTTVSTRGISSTNSSTSAAQLSSTITTTIANTTTKAAISNIGCASKNSPLCCADINNACTPKGASCSCDSACTHFGDCCSDYTRVCVIACKGLSCGPNATCQWNGTSESYNCTCKPGFSGDGTFCEDIDECLQVNCSRNAICTNTIGSYSCVCKNGFTGDGTSCVDINECSYIKCGSNCNCQNTEGSYICVCNDSNAGTNSTNFNISSIQLSSVTKTTTTTTTTLSCKDLSCSPNSTCQWNGTSGSYSCTCKPGFSGNGTSCTDIDECPQVNCGPNSVCRNTIGSYTCVCKYGFTGNGTSCVDINECLLVNCGPNSNCQNTLGSYICACNNGYSGVNCINSVKCENMLCPYHYCGDVSTCKVLPDTCRLSCSCTSNVCLKPGTKFFPSPSQDTPMRSVLMKLKLKQAYPGIANDPNSADYKNLVQSTDKELTSILKMIQPMAFAYNQNITLSSEMGILYAYVESDFFYWSNRSVIELLNSDLKSAIISAVITQANKTRVARDLSVNLEPPPEYITDKVLLTPEQLAPHFNCSSLGQADYTLSYGPDGFVCTKNSTTCTENCLNGGECQRNDSGSYCSCRPVSIYSPFGKNCENLALNLNAFFGILFGALAFLLLLLLLIFLIVCCCCCKKRNEPLPTVDYSNDYQEPGINSTIYNVQKKEKAEMNKTLMMNDLYDDVVKWKAHETKSFQK
ncbi:uncharacterized protein LOC122800843 [Protopterus annectens]|uniref:uncharacterized protein LOC122800843 n=1 Tax=Protopterus annectens TaxID=7888 RepID=UPI001CFA4996|nr:uncharacterized protein LOC122800843 [Protopterus annectens]